MGNKNNKVCSDYSLTTKTTGYKYDDMQGLKDNT